MKLPVSCVLYPGAQIDRLTEIKDKLFVKLGSLGYNQHERLLKRFGNLQQARSSRSNSALWWWCWGTWWHFGFAFVTMYLYLQVKDRCMEAWLFSIDTLCQHPHQHDEECRPGEVFEQTPRPSPRCAHSCRGFSVRPPAKEEWQRYFGCAFISLYMYSTSSLLLLFPPDTVNSVRLRIVDFL